MSIQVQGNGGTIAEVDGTTFRALRVTARPIDYGALGFYRLAMVSGTMAAALAANSEIFQHRWADATRFAVTYRAAIAAGANVAATATALVAFRLTIARSWTVAGSGGTRANLTGNNQKLRTSMGTSLVNDAGISTTGLLTAGTKTLDAQDVGAVATGIGTGAITTAVALPIMGPIELLNIDSSSDHPIVAAQNEGWVIRTGPIFPAALTWHFAVSCSWAEVAAY
ncbi:MAG: hypothetical protein ACRD1X_17930 [Vicinamibacteria bacterium]